MAQTPPIVNPAFEELLKKELDKIWDRRDVIGYGAIEALRRLNNSHYNFHYNKKK
jgi:hypothetical protein